HHQNTLEISFVSPDYLNGGKNTYAYRLLNYDEDWVLSGQRNFARYTQLPPGNYVFQVKASNGQVWNENLRQLTVRIAPPWWQTYWAYLIYFLVGLGIIWLIINYRTRRQALQFKLELEQAEAHRLKELDQFKDRFYTNITHEFRTPLTVIGGLTQQIENQPTVQLKERLNIIKKNTQNVLGLVNQLLDLAKMESQNVSMQYEQLDVILYLRYLTESFQSVAFDKKIMLSYHAEVPQLWMDVDAEKLKNIVVNLVVNALKFTPIYGKVKVVVSSLNQQEVEELISGFSKRNLKSHHLIVNHLNRAVSEFLSIQVNDSGRGIDFESLPKLFDRFYQANASDSERKGSGLGLGIVKEMVALHKGGIRVESQLKEGTNITIVLPIERKANYSNVLSEIPKSKENEGQQLTPFLETVSKNRAAKILIVEDNKDVIYYLKSCLGAQYEIQVAHNGEEGQTQAIQLLPDLIISDVMMPVMDGFTLCQQLKKDGKTAVIPVILLTARATEIDKFQGLTYGADAYLTKPFNAEELHLVVRNLLNIREKIKAQILEVQPAAVRSETDADFLDKLHQIILTNLSQEDFNTDRLCRAMAISKTQLYRKLKALTGFSTADYLQHIRLQKAKILLTTTSLTVGEISVQVGFKTQAHFSRSFSQKFGKTPSGIRK
ncbi:MAG: hybrid sensor histidine kinase/response regulator transcription factor, partial [Bacteroidota bacterium]